MFSPDELQRLPPRAHTVIRFLASQDVPASVGAIRAGTGLGERGAGKAIRRLVTDKYVEMPAEGHYVLTEMGRQAASVLGSAGAELLLPVAEDVAPAETDRCMRRLAVVLAQELVIDTPARVMAGLDAPGDHRPLREPARLILRLGLQGGEVEPAERPLEVPVDGPVGPAAFRLTPRQTGRVRLTLEASQVMPSGEVQRVGGLYFDMNVAEFPTPQSAEIHALGASLALHFGGNA